MHNGILQKYVKPVGLNHTLMVVWTPRFFLAEKRFDVKEVRRPDDLMIASPMPDT